MRSLIFAFSLIVVACGGSSTSPRSDATTVPVTEPPTTVAASSSTTAAPTTTTTVVTTTTTAPEVVFPERFSTATMFESVGQSAIITHGEPGTWNGRYTDPGAAVFVDGTMHVLQNGFPNWPARVGVGHWSSDDRGDTWINHAADPVFDGTELPYVGVAALSSSVHVEADGTWVMYFYSWDQGTWPVSTSSIGRATAPSPDGPWVADESPVLEAGSEGSWDEMGVRAPTVVVDESGYTMWFTGTTREQAMIGMATSADGITWEKYDDPATEGAFADSDPVLLPGSLDEGNVWDQRNVFQPRVVHSDDGFVMVYTSSNTVTDPQTIRQKVGLAVSDDGLNWRRSRGAVIDAADAGGSAIWWTELAHDGDRYYLFIELGTGTVTEVYLATHDGSLFED